MIKTIEAQDQMMMNLQDGCERAKQNSKAAENTYKRTLENMNKSIDEFHKEFKPLLNKLQESDFDQIEFMKFNIQKFSGLIESLGTETSVQGDHMLKLSEQISPIDDLNTFISANKSQNCDIVKEEF